VEEIRLTYTINIHYTLFRRKTLAPPSLVDTYEEASLDSSMIVGEKQIIL